jgi:hypothetical protein
MRNDATPASKEPISCDAAPSNAGMFKASHAPVSGRA